MCQSHTGRLTGLWFLPKPAFGLNTNDDGVTYDLELFVVQDQTKGWDFTQTLRWFIEKHNFLLPEPVSRIINGRLPTVFLQCGMIPSINKPAYTFSLRNSFIIITFPVNKCYFVEASACKKLWLMSLPQLTTIGLEVWTTDGVRFSLTKSTENVMNYPELK